MDKQASKTIRVVSSVTLFLGIILAISWVGMWLIGKAHSETLIPTVLQAIFFLMIGVGFWAGLAGVAAILERAGQASSGGAGSNNVEALAEELVEIRQAVAQLQKDMTGLPQAVALVLPPPVISTVTAGGAEAVAAGDPAVARQVVALLEEIREMTLLTEAQRQERLVRMRQQRKVALIQKANHHINLQQWAMSEQAMAVLDAEFPRDADVARTRMSLTAGRQRTEAEALQTLRTRVQDNIALSSWDTALKLVQQFVENFPGSVDGQTMLEHVARERDIFMESTVNKMYEEVKHESERKSWRRALAAAQRLMDKYPDHRRTEKIRTQLTTIQGNAEIEERQEAEMRIHELVRAKRYSEAIRLAEDIINRFPASPQADTLEELVPKLREIAIQEEADSIVQ